MAITRKKAIFCDFDGTIIEQDIGRIMVPKLAPEWWSRVREIYPLVLSGQMGSRSWYYWKFLQAKIHMDEYVDLVSSVTLTAGFIEFYEFVRANDYEFIILSDGFESYIRMVLDRLGIEEQVSYSNTLEISADSLKLQFPYHNRECGYCAMCKAGVVASYVRQGYETIFIGDGITDVFAAQISDKVFAKDSLAKQCENAGVNFTPFRNFWDIMDSCKDDFNSKKNTPRFHQRCESLQREDIVLDKVEM